MHVLTGTNVAHGMSNRESIFDHLLPNRDIDSGVFVPGGNDLSKLDAIDLGAFG